MLEYVAMTQISDIPIWLSDTDTKPRFPPLVKDIQTEVAVIGGGIAGVLTTYRLVESGKKVVLLEKAALATQVTGYTTAFLTYVIDTDLPELVKMLGEDQARLVWQSGKEAIDFIEAVVNEHDLECEFMRCDEYVYAEDQSEAEELKERTQLGKKLGFPLEFVEKVSVPWKHFGAVRIPEQAKFHPVKFVQGVAQVLSQKGGEIYEQTELTDVSGDGPYTLQTPTRTVTAECIVSATYQPFFQPLSLFFKKGTYETYVIECHVAAGTLAAGLYLDMENPYHYLRVDRQKGYDRVLLGGEDHRHEVPLSPEKSYAALDKYFYEHFPAISYTVARQWHGPILEPVDGLPYIGPLSAKNPTKLVATGFSGNGMTYSAIASLVLTTAILGKKDPYAGIYAADRLPSVMDMARKGADYTGEFFGGAVKDIVTPSPHQHKE